MLSSILLSLIFLPTILAYEIIYATWYTLPNSQNGTYLNPKSYGDVSDDYIFINTDWNTTRMTFYDCKILCDKSVDCMGYNFLLENMEEEFSLAKTGICQMMNIYENEEGAKAELINEPGWVFSMKRKCINIFHFIFPCFSVK